MAANAGSIQAELLLNNSQFMDALNEATESMGGLEASSADVSAAQDEMAVALAATGTGITALIGSSILLAARFEQSMAKVAAISGATAGEFELLTKTAKDLGASTAFSSTEAADGMSLLAAAGFKTNDIISAMPGLLNLAGAAQTDLAQSADWLGSIMSGFGVDAEDSAHSVDVLVQAMNDANTDLPDMAEAMKYVGPVAASLQLSLEDTAAAVALLSNYGIKGSQAGTSLRAMFLAMTNPVGQAAKAMDELGISYKQANGEMKPLPEILDHVNDKMSGLTNAQKTQYAAMLVGSEASSGFLALLSEGGATLDTFATKLEGSDGAAAAFAGTMQDTLSGAWEELTSSIEGVSIEIGEAFLPEAKKAVDIAAKMVDSLSKVSPQFVELALKIGAGATSAGLLYFALLKIPQALKVLQLSMGPAGWLMLGLGAVAGAMMRVSDETKESAEVNLDHVKSLDEQKRSLEDSVSAYDSLASKSKLSTDELGRYADIQARLKTETDPSKIKGLQEEMGQLTKKSGLSNEQLDKMLTLNDEIITQSPNAVSAISASGKALIGNTDEAKKYIEALERAKKLELEKQTNNAEAGLQDSVDKQAAAQKEMVKHATKYKGIQADIFSQQSKVAQAQLVYDAAKKSGDAGNIFSAKQGLDVAKGTLSVLEGQETKEKGIVIAKAQAYEKEQQKLLKSQAATRELINYHLAQSGITAEKGKEIAAIDKTIAKTKELRDAAVEAANADGKVTGKEQAKIDKLNEQLQILGNTKLTVAELVEMQNEFSGAVGETIDVSELLNLDLAVDVKKNLELISNMTPEELAKYNKELAKGVKKKVKVDDGGSNGKNHKEATKNGKKTVEADDKGSNKKNDKEATKKGTKKVDLDSEKSKKQLAAWIKEEKKKPVIVDDKGSNKKNEKEATKKGTKAITTEDKGSNSKNHKEAEKKGTKWVSVDDRLSNMRNHAAAIKSGKKNITVETPNYGSWLANLTRPATKKINILGQKIGAAWDKVSGKKHSGGTVHELPKFHEGGSPSLEGAFGNYGSAPKFDEVDVRILRNEMVLTQGQQASLFNMIGSFGSAALSKNKNARSAGEAAVKTTIQVSQMVIREEADITRVAEELDRLATQRQRARGEY